MNKYLSGIVFGFVAMLLGGWLMVSPFALGSQGAGDWNGQTQVEFWTGLAVLIVAVLAQLSYGMGLAEDLRARGLVQPRPVRTPAESAPAAPTVLQSNEPRLEDMLAPLIAALQQDLNGQRAQPQQPAPQTASAPAGQTLYVQPAAQNGVAHTAPAVAAQAQNDRRHP